MREGNAEAGVRKKGASIARSTAFSISFKLLEVAKGSQSSAATNQFSNDAFSNIAIEIKIVLIYSFVLRKRKN